MFSENKSALTHHLNSAELDALRTEMLDRAEKLTGPACAAWMDAVILLDKHCSASFQRRARRTAGPARKARPHFSTPICSP